MPDRFTAPVTFDRRDSHPPPLRADFYSGDNFTSGMMIHPAKSAILGVNNVTKSKGIIAGAIDDIPDAGVGGRSDAKFCAGVYGFSENGTGVHCKSVHYEALHAETESVETAAIAAYQLNPGSTSAALFAKHTGGGMAGVFEGNLSVKGDVNVTGDIRLMNADIAEDFTILDAETEPGTVMIFNNDGALIPCNDAYDKKVAGVISGAGSYKPGMILDTRDPQENRRPVALLGKVYCKVDADFGSIEAGDMLTTSSTTGHAMKVNDIAKAFGTVIGKAMGSFTSGKGLIPILVNLK